MKQRRDVGIAEDKVKKYERDLAELEDELAGELSDLEYEFDPNRTVLEPEVIKPYKKDIDVKSVSLLWLPYDRDEKPVW